MSATSKRGGRPSGVSDEGVLIFGAVTLGVVAVGLAWSSLHLAAAVLGAPEVPLNPAGLVVGLLGGETVWTTAATVAAVAQVVIVVVLVVGVWVFVRRGRRGANAPGRVDRADRYMGQGAAIASLTQKRAQEVATRLGVEAGPGIRMGSTLKKKVPLYRSWEDVVVTIAGPRTGKTSALVIPEILAAPGAVLVTSNKGTTTSIWPHVCEML